MVEIEERELLLQSLKGYLEELRESGVDELAFAEPAASESPRQEVSQGRSVPEQRKEVEHPGEGVEGERHGVEGGCRGVGNPRARLLFVMTGAGFSGEAGGLLEKIINAMQFATSDVYLLSFQAGSSGAGLPFREELLRRIKAVGPEVVVTLGEESAQLLLESRVPVAKLRGRFQDLEGIPLMPTLHPDAMLANLALKRDVWNDMQQVMRRLDQPG